MSNYAAVLHAALDPIHAMPNTRRAITEHHRSAQPPCSTIIIVVHGMRLPQVRRAQAWVACVTNIAPTPPQCVTSMALDAWGNP